MGKVEGLDNEEGEGVVGGWQWEAQGLRDYIVQGGAGILRWGNRELNLPCQGQEWGQALPMREDGEAGLRSWTLTA